MDERRKQLGLRWKDVADAADVSEETIRMVRKGGRRAAVRATRTEAKIEQALQWEFGSIKAIRDGGRPTALPNIPSAARTGQHRADGYPTFVGQDSGYRALWDLPDEVLPAAERRYAIFQIELLRWMSRKNNRI